MDDGKLPNKAHQGMMVEGYITLERISNVLCALLFISSKVFNVIRKFVCLTIHIYKDGSHINIHSEKDVLM